MMKLAIGDHATTLERFIPLPRAARWENWL